jgi:hypothetical protein
MQALPVRKILLKFFWVVLVSCAGDKKSYALLTNKIL